MVHFSIETILQSEGERRRPTLKRLKKYDKVAEVTGITAGKEVWNDEELLRHRSIELKVLGDEEMLNEVKIFLHGLHVNMSPRAIASALLLTWNMRANHPVETRIFPEEDPGKSPHDYSIQKFEEENVTYIDETINEMVRDVSHFEIRRAGAFLAASTLRLFTKGTSTWTAAWEKEHFSKRYVDFNKKKFPFTTLSPGKDAIEEMYEAYQGQKIFVGTLARILYSLADLADGRQTEMLFEQHLTCTGMHIIPQFIMAKVAMGARTGDLLSALATSQNMPTLDQLMNLINNSLSLPLGPENRGTWRFARLFDQGAFPFLQTKYAQDTVAILAHINRITQSSNSYSNPLQIAVLKQMGAKRLNQSKAVAHNIYHYFVS